MAGAGFVLSTQPTPSLNAGSVAGAGVEPDWLLRAVARLGAVGVTSLGETVGPEASDAAVSA